VCVVDAAFYGKEVINAANVIREISEGLEADILGIFATAAKEHKVINEEMIAKVIANLGEKRLQEEVDS